MLKSDQEVEYLQEQNDLAVIPEKYVGISFSKEMPKYWLDPRWEEFNRLYYEGKHEEASKLAVLIRSEWDTGG